MSQAVKQAYREVLKLVKRLPPPSRGYYAQYARENFVTYSEVEDPESIRSLLARVHHHTCWVLKKVVGVVVGAYDQAAMWRVKLKLSMQICKADSCHVGLPVESCHADVALVIEA
uniref:Complex 1 LYR protein domain-containing protein n=1 Tax=Physcomitrium patens TaxID=3218 RepID=A0A7I4BG65_PHYPA|nr:LYR motif-containing protein PHYPADRAFT_186863 isoform X2 [Physcomitrium patens]|eukprot:XP_024401468.1 LYR motif-containing protein PHYPADRAFT_186863 isoform X2 [Physcomitrella patens]